MARNILIGGTSHVGKSTLGRAVADVLGCALLSTDAMARHPGRPWPMVRPHVADFYSSLKDDSIFTLLLHHHGTMWPGLQSHISKRARAGHCVFEGSALRPEYLATLASADNLCVCLVAPEALIRERVMLSSNYEDLAPASQRLVDRFLERSLRDNAAIIAAAEEHSIECVDASDAQAVAGLQERLIASLDPKGKA